MNIARMFRILKRKLKYFVNQEGSIIEYEILYGEIWNSMRGGVKWLNNVETSSLFPGRWAIGYNTMYVLVRVLNALFPHNVLEFGLGNSSKIISQYFSAQNSGDWNHIIVEHNEEWIDFIKNEKSLSKHSKIYRTEIVKRSYKKHNVIAYKNIKPIMNLKYDLILIDGPLGTEGRFSRVDLLKYIPGCLNESFVIIVDDYQRKGEKGMACELETLLRQNNIDFVTGVYLGETECFVVASKNLFFLTTL